MTHFSDADGRAASATSSQAFEAATRDLPGERSLANSAAALRPPTRRCAATGCAPASPSTAARPTSPSTTSRTGACSPP
jgi:hypothetical protein